MERPATPPDRVQLFGLIVDVVTLETALGRIEQLMGEGGIHQHVAVNVDKVVKAAGDHELRQAINSADLVTADGQPVVWASWLLGKPLPERVTGVDLMTRLFVLAQERGYSIFLLGARPWVVERVQQRLRREYPGLRIAGAHHGYFSAAEEPLVVESITTARPDILFVAMSSPAKERFIARWKGRLGARFVMGVGGAFDVYAGVVGRAPRWMQRLGLEWLFRLIQEPKRMWRRYLVDDVAFVKLLLRELRRSRSHGGPG
jgi:N-acetylglucosaminyldiphosphoundecaprenol N-acetyl-beta-D-mannosaminyltransferase